MSGHKIQISRHGVLPFNLRGGNLYANRGLPAVWGHNK